MQACALKKRLLERVARPGVERPGVDQAAYQITQISAIHPFGDDQIEPRPVRIVVQRVGREAGEGHQQDATAAGPGAAEQRSGGLEAVAIGFAQVENHEFGAKRYRHPNRLPAALHRPDVVPLQRQQANQLAGADGIVIGNKNPVSAHAEILKPRTFRQGLNFAIHVKALRV